MSSDVSWKAHGNPKRKATLEPRHALDDFFLTPWLFYFDHEIIELRRILEANGMLEWSLVPRLYIIFRGLGFLHLISTLVAQDISDDSLPLDRHKLESAIHVSRLDFTNDFERFQKKVTRQPYDTYSNILQEYFPPHRDIDQNPLDDVDFQQIGRLLAFCNKDDAAGTPKIYYVLRLIGKTDNPSTSSANLLHEFHRRGYNDMWFPFPSYILRAPLITDRTTREAFIRSQEYVCSSRWSEDTHLNFSDEQDFLKLQKNLGSGATGQVTHVSCPSFRKHYARKLILRRDGLRYFANEVKVLKSVTHWHCVSLVCSYTDPDYLAILFQPVADMNLGTLLEEARSIPKDRKELLQSFFGCLSVALSYLHTKGIRHKDIKPGNILIHNNNVLLADFGLSTDSSNANGTTSIVGNTPRYNSPEFEDGYSRDEASDIWSLGCVFLEMLAALQGSSISDVKRYFRSKGTRRETFNANPDVIKSWFAEECLDENLAPFGSMAVTAKSVTAEMLSDVRDARPSSSLLIQRFGGSLEAVPSMYGRCCRGELLRANQDQTTSPTGALPSESVSFAEPLEPLTEEPVENSSSSFEQDTRQYDREDDDRTITTSSRNLSKLDIGGKVHEDLGRGPHVIQLTNNDAGSSNIVSADDENHVTSITTYGGTTHYKGTYQAGRDVIFSSGLLREAGTASESSLGDLEIEPIPTVSAPLIAADSPQAVAPEAKSGLEEALPEYSEMSTAQVRARASAGLHKFVLNKPITHLPSPEMAIAQSNSTAEYSDDLAFSKGDVIKVLERPLGSQWWIGQFQNRKGIFPHNLVRIASPYAINPPLARAAFTFVAEQPGDLEFKKGEFIHVIGIPLDILWWTGRIADRQGIFPRNYVTLIFD